MTNVIVEIGKSYLNGYGQRRTIITQTEDGRYHSAEGGPFSWFENGEINRAGLTTKLDLVSEYTDDESPWGVELIPGQIYICANGQSVTIMLNPEENLNGSEYVFKGSNGMYYTSEGRIYTQKDGSISTPFDIDGPSRQKSIINKNAYGKFGEYSLHEKFTLSVECVLDAIPGPWAQPEDLMVWMTQHPYVSRVVLDTEDRTACKVEWGDIHPEEKE